MTAKSRMSKELNIINVIKKVRFSYEILKDMITKKEMRLMKFQKKTVIDIDNSASDSKSCSTDYDWMPEFEKQLDRDKNLYAND